MLVRLRIQSIGSFPNSKNTLCHSSSFSSVFTQTYQHAFLSPQKRSFSRQLPRSSVTASISSTLKTRLDPTHFTPSKSFRNETASLGSKALIDKLIQRHGQILDVSLRNPDLVSRIGPMKSGQLLKSAILEDEASNISAFESSSEWNAFRERVPIMLQEMDLEVERGYRIPSLPRIRDPWLRALAWEVNQIGLSGKGLFVNDIEDYMIEDNHRLEHVGDGLLYALARTILYDAFPDLNPAWSSRVSNLLVSNEILGHLWDFSGLDTVRNETRDKIWDRWEQKVRDAFTDLIKGEASELSLQNPNVEEIANESLGSSNDKQLKPTWKPLGSKRKADYFEAYCAAFLLSEKSLDGQDSKGYQMLQSWLDGLYAPIIRTIKIRIETLKTSKHIPHDKLKIHSLARESHEYAKSERYLTNAAKLRARDEREREKRKGSSIWEVGLDWWGWLKTWFTGSQV